MDRVLRSSLLVVVAVGACNNEDLPDTEPTIGHATESPPATDGGTAANLCAPDYEPADPALFQCVGEGNGSFTNKACRKVTGCDSESDWEEDQSCVDEEDAQGNCLPIPFPPDPPDEEPNAQACCEGNADPENIDPGCISDCARAACNIALQSLQDKRDGDPPQGCPLVSGCVERWEKTLDTWIAFLEDNYDSCVEIGSNNDPNDFLQFPNPDVQSGAGAGKDAQLRIECTITDDATEVASTCEDSLNPPPPPPGGMIQLCNLDGDVEIDGPEGNDFTTLEGTVLLHRGFCATDPCWFSIESLDLEADTYSDNGYMGRDMVAALKYVGFGLYDDATDDGTIAPMMLGLDVSLYGATPSTRAQTYEFSMANSDSALFETTPTGFQIVDAYFAWDDYDLTITTTLGTCSCLNCV